MSTTLQYARKVGGSLMVTIPKEIAELEHISAGEMVSVEVRKVKRDYFGALRGLKPLKKSEKWDIHE